MIDLLCSELDDTSKQHPVLIIMNRQSRRTFYDQLNNIVPSHPDLSTKSYVMRNGVDVTVRTYKGCPIIVDRELIQDFLIIRYPENSELIHAITGSLPKLGTQHE